MRRWSFYCAAAAKACGEYSLPPVLPWHPSFCSTATASCAAGKKGPEQFAVDEHPRPESTPESLAKLPAVFKKGADATVTAGNASGICDGAAALVIATGDAVKAHGLTPLARVVGWCVCGGGMTRWLEEGGVTAVPV